jgi:hypothetical protein
MSDNRPGLPPDDVQIVDNVLRDTPISDPGRRALVKKASLGAAGLGMAAFVAACGGGSSASSRTATSSKPAASAGGGEVKTLIDTAITAEALAVTYLSGLIQNASSTGVTKFVDVLKAANAAEYDHYKALKSLGAKPLTTRFWAPNDFFKPGNVFPTLEVAETLFVNAYLIGIGTFVKAGKPDYARYAGEILGTEAEHLTLARYAQNKLPNNLGFMDYSISSIGDVVAALEQAGVGFGKQGSKPGKFYSFAPPPAGTVTAVSNRKPE